MNVREKAKNYEAFMSKSSSMEREKKRSRDEGIETSGPGMVDKRKMAEEEKNKPVPPPRKKKPLEKPERNPQPQRRSTLTMQLKSPAVIHPKPSKPPSPSDNEKAKSSRKPPPPRPAPYQQPSSPSLETKVSQPRTVPKRPSPVVRPAPGSPKTSVKETPKRPPPPSKTSSLPRKPKPPVPPKPRRPVKPGKEAAKEKSATLPKTGSLKLENKTEDKVENVETKAERSLTGPHRISLENKEVEKTEKTIDNVPKDIGIGEKVALHLDTEKNKENVIKQTVGNAEFKEEKETPKIQVHGVSLAEDLSQNGDISNGVSQEEKHNRSLKEEIFKNDGQPETILKEEILDNTDEKMDLDKNDIVTREEVFTGNFTGNFTENDRNVAMDKQSDRVVDAQNEDEGKQEEVKEENEHSQSVSLENSENLSGVELCEETPLPGDLSLEVEKDTLEVTEEKPIDTTEDSEVIANGHLEGDDFSSSQSVENGNETRPTQTTEPLHESTPIDIKDSTEKNFGINNYTTSCEDEEVSGIDEALEREKVQPVHESAVYDEDKSHLSEETAAVEEKSGDQDGSGVIAGVEEQSDVQQTEETQLLEVEEVVEAIPKEAEQPADEEKHDQDDSVLGIEEGGEEIVDMEKDVTTQDEQCENEILMAKANEINRNEEMEEGTLVDAMQQNESKLEDFNEVSLEQPLDVTTEDNLLLQGKKTETAAEEQLPGQTVETQSSFKEMEGVSMDADHHGEFSSDQDVPIDGDSEKLAFILDNSRDKDTEMDIENQGKTEINGKISEEENEPKKESISSKTEGVDQQNDPFSLDEPIRPRRPSRLKKLAKNNIKEAGTITASKPLVESQIAQIEEEYKEEPQPKHDGPYGGDILNVSSNEGLPEPLQDSEQRVPEKASPEYENVVLPGSEADQSQGSESSIIRDEPSNEGLPEPLLDSGQCSSGKSSSGYENVILPGSEADQSQESESSVIHSESRNEGLAEPLQDSGQRSSEKPSSGYENVILPGSEADQTQENESSDIRDEPSNEGLPEPLQDSGQRFPEKPSPRYENVILPGSEADQSPESESFAIYEVPRRSSFHSHTSEEKISRKTRSSSIGSLKRKSASEYQVPKPRSRTVAVEETYVVPKPQRLSIESSENDETYVVPRVFRTTSPSEASPVCESEYNVPQSLAREVSTEAEYQVPPRVRSTTGSEEKEGVYSVPPSTVHRESRTEHPSEEEEGVYSVPPSSMLRGTHVETERVRQHSECNEEAVYSVPNTPVAKETEPSSEATLSEEGEPSKRSSRSSVLTSRNQLPMSFKRAPPKPPRKSISGESKSEEKDDTSILEDEDSKPVPVPRVIPQPKPRHGQADSSSENKEVELPAPSSPKDQSKVSPKPKRPAPPRPKAPSFSPLVDKENDVTVEQEAKNHSAPPRPPPPYVNRTSFAPSESESVSSATALRSESSESESEEEKPQEPTGPPKKKTYFIAHEILSTEKTFVNALTLCYEDCYGLIRSADVVPESILNDIFKDLGNIYHLDCKFLQELEERMKTWDEHERIGDIVKKYGHFLKMYTTYINNYDKAMNVLQETTKENPQFAELVNQFQASDKCKGLFLISFMLKPVQRIPSYRLLLKDYLKHLPPDSEEFKDIKVALDIVSEVATHINESMKKADNFERVLRIQESLVGNAEIVKPGRDLIKEGVLKKLCRKDMQERMFFLLTDVLLYTAPVGSTQYKLKEKLPLLGMKVTLPESPDFENEFSIISKMRSFTLSASTPAERDEWIEKLKNAINALADKKKTFLKPKDGTVADTEVEEESKLGEKAPVWIPDARVTMCMLCTDNFTVTNRRHHCRGCGKVVCGSCSDNLAPLAYLDYVQARVCEVCYDFLLKEQNKSESNHDFAERLPASPLGMTNEDLDRIHRKPPKFEILHRFKPGSRSHSKRKSKAFGRPSVCTEVVGHDSGSQMSGYLKFKRNNKHGWKRLWFVLKDNVLYMYKASEDVVAIETIPILGYNVQEATRTEDEIQFQLKHAGLPPITFKTESESSVSRWIQELKKATKL